MAGAGERTCLELSSGACVQYDNFEYANIGNAAANSSGSI